VVQETQVVQQSNASKDQPEPELQQEQPSIEQHEPPSYLTEAVHFE
jgi:hypothetical protein